MKHLDRALADTFEKEAFSIHSAFMDTQICDANRPFVLKNIMRH